VGLLGFASLVAPLHSRLLSAASPSAHRLHRSRADASYPKRHMYHHRRSLNCVTCTHAQAHGAQGNCYRVGTVTSYGPLLARSLASCLHPFRSSSVQSARGPIGDSEVRNAGNEYTICKIHNLTPSARNESRSIQTILVFSCI
jgi:hypothetical protein